MPSDAVSTTVPVSAGSGAVRPATEASSCAGVRSGSSGEAWALPIMEPAVTAAREDYGTCGNQPTSRDGKTSAACSSHNLTRPRAHRPHGLVLWAVTGPA